MKMGGGYRMMTDLGQRHAQIALDGRLIGYGRQDAAISSRRLLWLPGLVQRHRSTEFRIQVEVGQCPVIQRGPVGGRTMRRG